MFPIVLIVFTAVSIFVSLNRSVNGTNAVTSIVERNAVFFHKLCIQNYWVFGLRPSSGILKNQRTLCFGNWISFHPQVTRETLAVLGDLGKANLNHRTTYVSINTAL
jgi:hypothetical protein